MIVAVFALIAPTLDHENPTREQGIEVVEYWESEATWFEWNGSEGIDAAVKQLTLEVLSWGQKYDLWQTRRLIKSLARIMEVKKRESSRRQLKAA